MNLIECLQTIPDFRRKEGKRYELAPMLVIITMAIMSGRYRYREIALFAKANRKELVKQLKLKRAEMPSHVTFRQIIQSIDFDRLNDAFAHWAAGYVLIKKKDWVAVDGKALRSTLTDYDCSYQDFVSLISVFTHKRGQVLQVSRFHNKQESEVPKVERLLEALDLKGVVFTLDALHCKKNAANH